MTGASDVHPYCAVVVTVVPLDEDGKPDLHRTVTVSGIGGPITIEAAELSVCWVPVPRTGTRFTIAGSREWI